MASLQLTIEKKIVPVPILPPGWTFEKYNCVTLSEGTGIYEHLHSSLKLKYLINLDHFFQELYLESHMKWWKKLKNKIKVGISWIFTEETQCKMTWMKLQVENSPRQVIWKHQDITAFASELFQGDWGGYAGGQHWRLLPANFNATPHWKRRAHPVWELNHCS